MRLRLVQLLWALLALALGWAALRGYLRGGQDFRVFHHAGKLVLAGRWDLLYTDGPDRYLYAPGFALLIAPLSALPVSAALGLWLAGTLAALAGMFRHLSRRYGAVAVLFAGIFSFRALAIDLRYGQVNLWILAAAVWAISEWSHRHEASRRNGLRISWFLFSVAAVTKIYPLALFLFPVWGLCRGAEGDRRPSLEIAVAFFLGVLCVLGLPYLFHAYPLGGLEREWFAALSRKGLPTETHNQSFMAFLVRWVAAEPFHSLRLGGQTLQLGTGKFYAAPGLETLSFLAFIFFVATAAGVFRFVWRGFRFGQSGGFEAGLFVLALSFVPAHLIWKSYFVLGLPMLAAVFARVQALPGADERAKWASIYGVLGFSLAGGGLLPPFASAWMESASPFLWIHLAMVITGARLLWRRASSG